jgi:hypothetical protein
MRKFIHYGPTEFPNRTISIELYKGKDEFSIGLILQNDFEKTITFNLALPFLFKFYISIDTDLCKTQWWRKLLLLNEEHKYDGRRFGISLSPDEVAWGKTYYFSFDFGTYPWCSGGGLSIFKCLTDLVYGNFNYTKQVIEEWNKTVFIPGVGNYSDGTYDLIIKREVANWKWKRFNKTFTATYYDVECEKGVPHRFKWGTQDGLFSASFEATSVNEAIDKFIDCIQKKRMRYR